MFTMAGKEPLTVHCKKCQHEWALGFLPLPADQIGKLAKARCPACNSKDVLIGPQPKETGDGDWQAWIRNGDTGVSSETIWSVMTGCPVRYADIPYDPSDFGRCYRLLKIMPSWRARLPKVAERYPKWGPMVEAWEELTALYEDELANGPIERGERSAPKTYKRMLELREAADAVARSAAT